MIAKFCVKLKYVYPDKCAKKRIVAVRRWKVTRSVGKPTDLVGLEPTMVLCIVHKYFCSLQSMADLSQINIAETCIFSKAGQGAESI